MLRLYIGPLILEESQIYILSSDSAHFAMRYPVQDIKNGKWILNKLREAGKDYTDNGTPFFVAYGTFKPHTPFVFPERFLDYYPEESIGLPENPYAPVNMPETAWNIPPIFRQFEA